MVGLNKLGFVVEEFPQKLNVFPASKATLLLSSVRPPEKYSNNNFNFYFLI